ncbi:MAG TPA: ABC transporter permease subunit [Gemmataceae bacterium]|nr:ABC transporter permease subunit [Gemmataceae bacterium]
MTQQTIPRPVRRPGKRRRTPTPFFGPLGSWELVRLARKGQSHRGRLLTVYLLLIAFILTPAFWFADIDPMEVFFGQVWVRQLSEAAEFGRRFALVLMEAILLAVAAMAPGFAAAAIAEEKERRTLSLLLSSPLSDREIVLGKAVGRLGFVLVAALAGLPVVALSALFGGITLPFLVAGWVLIASTAVLATAIGIQAGTAAPDMRSSLVRAYGITALLVGTGVIPPFVFVSPFGIIVIIQNFDGWLMVLAALGYAGVQLLVAGVLLSVAVRGVRRAADEPEPPRTVIRLPVAEPPVPSRRAEPPPLPKWEPGYVPPKRPRMDDRNPLLWKERYVAGRRTESGSQDRARAAGCLFAALALILLFLGLGILLNRIWVRPTEDDMGGQLMLNGSTVALGLYLVPAAIGLAAAVARERHRQTLDALLALPVSRGEILQAKVRAAMERAWVWGPAAAVASGVAFGADAGWQLGLAAAAFVLAGIGLVAGLGAWLTVRSPTEVRALRFLVPAVVLVVGVPVGVWGQTDWSAPVLSVIGLAAGAAVFAVAGLTFWWRACRELGRAG